MKIAGLLLALAGILTISSVAMISSDLPVVVSAQQSKITVRTENYPRPPYSGATYYIYEQDDQVICTKLETCNKFGKCSAQYNKGIFKEEVDIATGEPSGKTPTVAILNSKLRKHACLTRFKLIR